MKDFLLRRQINISIYPHIFIYTQIIQIGDKDYTPMEKKKGINVRRMRKKQKIN